MTVPRPELAVGVVGAGGFLSGHLIPALRRAGHDPRVFGRAASQNVRPLPTDTSDLAGLDIVIHLAGIAHQKANSDAYAAVNVGLATDVATLCRDAGVGRFVFISTSQVHGRSSEALIGPQSPFNPPSAYAASKVRAEIEIGRLLGSSGTDLAIIRPTLVYAANAKANFKKLRAAARRGLPLPLGLANARRSMVSIENLNAAILNVATSGQSKAICLPADPEDLSVSEIYRILSRSAGHDRVALPPVPDWAMQGLMTLAGRADMFDSLFRPAIVDRRHWLALGWTPRQSAREGLKAAMQDTDPPRP